ncbi:MAG: hypothetical protein Q9212_002316 [Teloschistes hypoglaucus]
MTNAFKLTDLFGGAITANLPAGYADVSNIREVPDHQEIYLDASGFSSIVIEIAERVTEPPTDDQALRFHFEDIVDEQDSSRVWRTDIASFPNLPQNTPCLTLVATTTPPLTTNGNTRALTPTFVAILLTLIRLEPQSTDLIVTVNIPHIAGHQEPTDRAVNFEEGKFGSLVQEGVRVRDEVWRTLQVKDWGLFDGGKEDEV